MDDLRETIARAIAGDEAHQIWDDPEACECCVGWKKDMYLWQAADVIKALGLTEETRENGRNLHDGPDAHHWTETRYVTTWKRVP